MHAKPADLQAYYDLTATDRAATVLHPLRVDARSRFIERLKLEGRRVLVDIGCGPGVDTTAFAEAGLRSIGVDLSLGPLQLARKSGRVCLQASVLKLPLAQRSCDAAWTMSTLVHLDDDQTHAAIEQIRNVLVPGSPLAVGLWGGHDFDGHTQWGSLPRRYFRLRPHDEARALLAEHGDIEEFTTWPTPESDWIYQFAILRLS